MNDVNNMYAFILGRETKIALIELESVLRRFCFDFSILSVSGNVAIIKIKKVESRKLKVESIVSGSIESEKAESYKLEAKSLIRLLGGTIKIFEIVASGSNNLIDDIEKIVQENTVDCSGKLNLGISDYRATPAATSNINKIGLSVKNILKKSHNTRFVALKEGRELSSIVSYKNKLDSKGIEIGLFQAGIGKLVAVTNPEEWGKRDYDKPRGDKYSGMTPPKLARMLVNIALGKSTNIEARSTKQIQNNKSENPKQVSDFGFRISDLRPVVVDPFCGSGNILMEAMMLGCGVVGSDISGKAVTDTEENLKWLINQYLKSNIKNQKYRERFIKPSEAKKLEANSYKIFVADATTSQLTEELKNLRTEEQDIIVVTEPYLGSPKKFTPSMNAARGEYQKIKKIYLDFLKNLKVPMQESGSRQVCFVGTICVIFPLVETQEDKQYSLFSECLDEIKNLGYTLIHSPLIYGREYQIVKREIVLLRSNTIVTR